MYSATNSTTFLSYFNRIDGFLGIVLWTENYLPFAEKIDQLATGHYPVSNFVRAYQHKLKYFGDLRNQLVHGFSLDQHHYLLASDYAIQQIKSVQDALEKPPEVKTLFSRSLPVCTLQTPLQKIIHQMRQTKAHYLPIYTDKKVFIGLISERMIIGFLDIHPEVDTATISVDKVIAETTGESYLFMSVTTSLYEIEWVFSRQREEEKELSIIFLTASGDITDKIIGYITAADLPKITEAVIL